MGKLSAWEVRRAIEQLADVHAFLYSLRGSAHLDPGRLGVALAFVKMPRDMLLRASVVDVEIEPQPTPETVT
jgi:hypothetical protein